MSITLTERAASQARRWLGDRDLRLRVKTTGCSGYAYVLEPADTVGADDEVTESQGLRVVVDRKSLLFVRGTEVDYVREGLNAAFQFHNPNVAATCGCGESFTVATAVTREQA
jgi:iron-sulfur cluster assembly protein